MSAGVNTHEIGREHPERLSERFHARVHGRDSRGERFKLFTVIESIGSDGLSLKLPRKVAPGARLSVIVRFSTQDFDAPERARLAAAGTVLDARSLADGRCGVELRFRRHRFF